MLDLELPLLSFVREGDTLIRSLLATFGRIEVSSLNYSGIDLLSFAKGTRVLVGIVLKAICICAVLVMITLKGIDYFPLSQDPAYLDT